MKIVEGQSILWKDDYNRVLKIDDNWPGQGDVELVELHRAGKDPIKVQVVVGLTDPHSNVIAGHIFEETEWNGNTFKLSEDDVLEGLQGGDRIMYF